MHIVNVLRWVGYVRLLTPLLLDGCGLFRNGVRRMLTRIAKSLLLVLACHPTVRHGNIAKVPTEQEAG
jgi:hypothetical protein